MSETTAPMDSLIGARRLARTLTEPVCRSFGILPVGFENDIVTVAVPDASDTFTAEVLSRLLGHTVQMREWSVERIDTATAAVFADMPQTAELKARPRRAPERPAPTVRARLGEKLLDLGLITPQQSERALQEQARTGSRLGEILLASGEISEHDLLAVLADQFRLQHVDLSGYVPDSEVAGLIPEPVARGLRCVPLAANDKELYLAVADELSPDTHEMIAGYTHLELHELLATRNSIDELLQRIYNEQYIETAKNALRESDPENSADRVLSGGQRMTLLTLILAVVCCLVIWTGPTLIALVALASMFYLASSAYKARLIYKSLGGGAYIDVSDEQVAALDERDLPIYTILVPLYKEAAVIPHLLAGIGKLDYPQTKLDVRLLCEEDDDETINAIRQLNPPPHFKLVIVPESLPRTKPKACNYGILQADGEFVVIYDAEDRPDPAQLKKAVIAFRKGDPEMTCVQAKLNYFNTDQNLLTRWFSIEYSMHFDLLLPGLCAAKAPIPLGGTSNHFRKDRLIELGAWDPYNVTEDADLGIRLHKAGYTTAMIDSTTLEEANSSVRNWIRQRSRWIKGYIQTWLVHMRHPLQLCNQVGLRAFISFNLIVGGAFVFLLNPIFWLLTTLFLVTHAAFIEALFPDWIFYIASTMLFIGNFLFVYFNVAGSLQSGNFSLTRYALLSPVYWGLMSWAAWKGLIQLMTNPFYWEKTTHGLAEAHQGQPTPASQGASS